MNARKRRRGRGRNPAPATPGEARAVEGDRSGADPSGRNEVEATNTRGPATAVGVGLRVVAPGTCPRCGNPLPVNATGRPARWCSQACRRAAYEERRAASRGAIGLEVVKKVVQVDHPIDDCVERVLASPVAARKVLNGLAELAMAADADDPRPGAGLREARWTPVVAAALVLARDIHRARLAHEATEEPQAKGRRPGQVIYRRPDDWEPGG